MEPGRRTAPIEDATERAAVAPPLTPGHSQRRDWAWRRRIRQDPKKYRVYRIVVGVVGWFLVLLSGAIGWLPGPGGIPLFLLGLAVLASEFHWAGRMLGRARKWAHEAAERSRRRPRWVRWAGGAGVVACVLVAAWLGLRLFGLPGWLPEQATAFLGSVPGLG